MDLKLVLNTAATDLFTKHCRGLAIKHIVTVGKQTVNKKLKEGLNLMPEIQPAPIRSENRQLLHSKRCDVKCFTRS